MKSLQLQSTDSILRSGSTVETAVVSYARVPIEVRLELVQGNHSETLAVYQVPKNSWAFLDPRTQQASQNANLSDDVLSRFEAGKVLLRATATGRLQLTRLPPPLVRELVVEIR